MIGKTNSHARRLRRNSTQAEQKLWHRLRSRQLAGAKFRRQATIGPYVVDFLCIEAGLVIEADGGQHATADDAPRTACLEARGLRVMRFWNNDIVENIDGVLATIAVALEEKKEPSPQPSPVKTGEREKEAD